MAGTGSNGQFQIGGIQTNLPGGGQQAIGPYTVLCSDAQSSAVISVTTSTVVPVPATAAGVVITPPFGGDTAITVRTVSGDTGININPGNVGIVLQFDPDNMPADLYLTADGGGPVAVAVQFT